MFRGSASSPQPLTETRNQAYKRSAARARGIRRIHAEKDGIKTLQEIRKQKLEVDVIIVSAAKDKETIQLMLQNGAADYILKPFKLERMRQALENYKQYKRKIEEHDTMSQEQLDMLLKIPQNPSRDLPKG